ncbi:CDP-glycerol glycerophosphotransferase family protein [Romboutsia lituseburensis]|uniref:CDP-glycerol glycerophosphotransferase family protein n=1 Tax=Romboutsia lituseburensis TaxID=1537 RepID=UPI00215B288E|nr:CDP-glycerol glycerophosphotransferase family protein [Romboutsia lituseburensis]MCR8746709.1 CDP-glycerol glycerophosphotransferase family protein [Romboutsia lituseburensis]
MDIINEIQRCIIENDIELAYKTIVENEDELLNSAQYWNLRGILCYKIQEYDAAIKCYIKSINIKNDYLDSYFNLVYIYKITREKMKAALYSGLALKYTDDINFENELIDIFNDELLYCEYINLIKQVKNNNNINIKNLSFIKYISTMFEDIDENYISYINDKNIDKLWAFVNEDYLLTNKEILSISDYIKIKENLQLNIMIKYDVNYINKTRDIASKGVDCCFIMVENNRTWDLVEIDQQDMRHLKNKDYKKTVTLNKFNAADSNVYALINYMPQKYKEKYKLNIINGVDVFSIENVVKVPLLSSVTVSGFNTFTSYPKFTYNIEVGHGEVGFKGCGLMDKKNKQFSFTPEEYTKIDKICTISTMSMILLSSFAAVPENKYEITGNPRTDTLVLSDGKINLERLLKIPLNNKKVVFNMPTFYIHENTGLVSGSKELNDSIKIKNFDYKKFNEFLIDNEIIFISKVHHGEERTVTSKVKNRHLDNMIFISNDDLDKAELDLYEILNAADMLITDYSSIYGDFLFMDKPTIFVNTDMEKYEEERGIILQPYDFWAAGPKVTNQDDLSKEILKCINDSNYYKKERNTIRDIFYYHKDDKATMRVWDTIDRVLS